MMDLLFAITTLLIGVITIVLAFFNWRVMKQYDITIIAYARLKHAVKKMSKDVVHNLWPNNSRELVKFRLDAYQKHMFTLMEKVEIDKTMLTKMGQAKIDTTYDKPDEIINEFSKVCISASGSNDEHSKTDEYQNAKNLLEDDDKSFNNLLEKLDKEIEKTFGNYIDHPYRSYLCSKLSKFCKQNKT